MPKRLPILAVLLYSLAASACGQENDGKVEVELPELKPVTHNELLADLEALEGEVIVMNFWATWCAPCIKEFPDFMRIGKEFDDQGVELVFVSADFEQDVDIARQFLAEQGVTWTTYLKTGRDNPFINGINQEWSGALPATMIYDRAGTLVSFWEGSTTYQELIREIEPLL
ncbi:MAG: TlpA disulfide reductase family protein [Bacteroidota bacterium]